MTNTPAKTAVDVITSLKGGEDVNDHQVTGEGWLYTPTTFSLVARVPRASFDEHAILAHEDEERLDNDVLALNFNRRGTEATLEYQRQELSRLEAFLSRHWGYYAALAKPTRQITAEGYAT